MSSLTGPVLAEYQDLFSSTTTQGGPNGGLNLGAKAYTGDGREYRFALAGGTTLVPGKLQQAAAQDASNTQNIAVAAAAIGATSITTTTTVTLTANQLRGGYVMVSVTPGQGYQYRIKSNTAATAAVTTIQLEDPLLVALTTSSRVDLQVNPYSGVVVNPATASSAPVGVAIYPITNAQYGWIQVAGPTNILADGAVTVGTAVVASNATAGAVEALTGVQAPVGTALTDISTTEYGSIMLQLS